jgi:hypothetical protein
MSKTAHKLGTAQLLSLHNYITLHKQKILESGMNSKSLANRAQEDLKIYITPGNVDGILKAMDIKLSSVSSAPKHNPLARIMQEHTLIKEQLRKICKDLGIECVV